MSASAASTPSPAESASPAAPASPAADTIGPQTLPGRSLAPDVARGLMLALIAMANVAWLLWGHEGSVGTTPHVPARGPLDTAVQAVMTIAVDHRAMPLFAFLFGYGMVQFHRSRLDRGMEPRTVRVMLRRRHWAMLLLGLLHAALLFYGDILGAYAVAGLLLVWLFFERRTRTLIVWAAVLGGLMLLFGLFSLVGGAATMLFSPPEVLAQMEAGGAAYATDQLRDLASGQPYLPSMAARAGMWAITTIPLALFMAPLPILLGWIAARARLLDEPWRHTRTLRRLALAGIAIGWLTGLPDALVILGVLPLPDAVGWTFSGLNGAGGVYCGIGYAAAFGLFAARREGRRTGVTRALAAVGQRSLTFYLLQSVVLVPLMASWGLGLAPLLDTSSAVAVAAGVWLVSLPIAAWMDSRGMRGPAEHLLRRMTYGRHA